MSLMWTHMLIFSTFVMLTLTSFLYFFFVSLSNLHCRNKFPFSWQTNKTNKKFLWNWSW